MVVAATDVPGIQRLLPQSFRDSFKEFDNIYKLSAVPVVTVQLRWVVLICIYGYMYCILICGGQVRRLGD